MTLNERQQKLVDTIDGFVLVDAGPGTGKTHTITQRYLALLTNGIDPSEILMVTFTRNAAEEMRGRIRNAVINEGLRLRNGGNNEEQVLGEKLISSADGIRTSTFDAYSLRIVLNSPEAVSEFFGFKETLSRGAKLVESETLNFNHFEAFYNEFAKDNSHHYRKSDTDYPALVAGDVAKLFELINELMSKGILPMPDYDWYSDGRKRLLGEREKALDLLRTLNVPKSDWGKDDGIGKMNKEKVYSELPAGLYYGKSEIKDSGFTLPDEILQMAVYEVDEGDLDKKEIKDRKDLLYFIWHVYYEYLHRCVIDNRLTFAVARIFAFGVLHDKTAREQSSVDYMMVDEFQDTDEMQMMICLMLLKKANLCVVGDWKQGIYGFRNANVDNIRKFDEKVSSLSQKLADYLPYKPQKAEPISLNINYRSSSLIISEAFRAMELKGSSTDAVNNPEGSITFLESARSTGPYGEIYNEFTACDYAFADSIESEYQMILDRITEYVNSDKYMILEETDGGPVRRKPNYGDIAVLFRGNADCRKLREAAVERGIPAFLQGDIEIMSTPPAKLVLAWLRYVNDYGDLRGPVAILAYMGYSMAQIKQMMDSRDIPKNIIQQRDFLVSKRRRPVQMITSIFEFHGLWDEYEDITQSIIKVISSSHSGSLVTVADLIRMIEDDIVNGTTYPIDPVLGRKAVTIQTMHKSKGLEYPMVIVGGLSNKKMPLTQNDSGTFRYTPLFGLRSKKEFVHQDDGTEGIVDSWRYQILKNSMNADYDEERRLLFVSMSRAKQYMTVCSHDSPSQFFKDLVDGHDKVTPTACSPASDSESSVVSRPQIPEYTSRRKNLAVHDIMVYVPGTEEEGKGKQHGIEVHTAAQQMALGKAYDTKLKEIPAIRKILDSLKGAALFTEIDCTLPVGDVTIRGTIDLLADFGDRYEIHDYKTDSDERNFDSYITQLSVYAHSVQQAKGKPVKAFVDFVSLGLEPKEIEIKDMSQIEELVRSFFEESHDI